MTSKTLYQQLVEAGCEIDHHESDLYVRHDDAGVTDGIMLKWYDARLATRPRKTDIVLHPSYLMFRSNDGTYWYDIPFAYDPWWEARLIGRESR